MGRSTYRIAIDQETARGTAGTRPLDCGTIIIPPLHSAYPGKDIWLKSPGYRVARRRAAEGDQTEAVRRAFFRDNLPQTDIEAA